MTNQMISAAAASARENHRATDGKFGAQPLAEADLDLDASVDGGGAGNDIDATSGAEASQPADGEIVFRQTDGKVFAPEEVLKHAQAAARKYYEKYAVQGKTGTQLADKDDLASESVAAVAKMIRSWESGKGQGVKDMVATLRSCAANHAVRATAIVWRPVDRAAYIKYDEQLRLTESALQRPTTQKEKDALAEKIRDEWHDQRHKPSKEFRQAITVDRSLDRPMTADPEGPTMGDSLVAEGQVVDTILPGTFTDQVLELKDAGERSATTKLKRMGWNAIAEQNADLPMARKCVHNPREVSKLKKRVQDAGGVIEVFDRWEEGTNDESTEAAFSLFEINDNMERIYVVDKFHELESSGQGRAQTFWENTLAYTSTAHQD